MQVEMTNKLKEDVETFKNLSSIFTKTLGYLFKEEVKCGKCEKVNKFYKNKFHLSLNFIDFHKS